MLWRALHYLFGWHYFHARNSATEIVRRLHFSKSGSPYGVYFGQHIIWLDQKQDWTITLLTYDKPTEGE
jgi:hypothetical protein